MRDGTVNPCGFIMYIGREAADQAKAYIAANTGGTGATCSTAENNIDYIGNDLTSRTSSTASGCCAICAATSGCKPYSWSGGTCWLKSAKGTTQIDEQVKMLRRSLHGMHKKVQDEKERRRVQDMAAHKGSTANFDVGDFVLCISSQTTELLELVSRQRMVLGVEDIRNHRFNDALVRWELQVSWMGLQAIEDSWEPLDVLAQDVPVKVRDYIIASGDDDLSAQLE
ncbi:hypothetical protein PC119_g21766 [Phytophthora cactorum]|nr:hypothetical protein PC119_g21766 [Phytophthora cactorum]